MPVRAHHGIISYDILQQNKLQYFSGPTALNSHQRRLVWGLSTYTLVIEAWILRRLVEDFADSSSSFTVTLTELLWQAQCKHPGLHLL